LAPHAAVLGGLKAAVVGNDGHPPAADAGSILVGFGADDPLALTEATLRCLLATSMFVQRESLPVVVQMGSTAIGRATVERLVGSTPGWRMAPSGRTSPGEPVLAIGAAGVSLLERMHAGVPSVVIVAAPNQGALAEVAARAGAVVVEGSPRAAVAAALRLLEDPMRRGQMSVAARAAVDGRGAERVAGLINRMVGVLLRRATIEDAPLLHRWRNHPDVRRFSLTTAEIAWEDHLAWLESSLRSQDRHVLIAERRGHPVGTLRFDVTGDCATVSIAVSPANRGVGYGPAILDTGLVWLRTHDRRVKRLRAVVRSENVASEHAFLSAGYARGTDSLERGIEEGGSA
jgi:RimJ/RimL family protein N-acetyltransferase